MNEGYNKRRFNLYSHIYAPVGNYYKNHRKLNFDKLNIQPNNRVLVIGVGTGQDLQFLKNHQHVYLADVSKSMLKKSENYALNHNIKLISKESSIFNLKFADDTFDIIILHFMLSVVKNPLKATNELKRVLKNEGQISIIDNHFDPQKSFSFIRKYLNYIFKPLAFNIEFNTLEFIKSSNFVIQEEIIFGVSSFFRGYICKLS